MESTSSPRTKAARTKAEWRREIARRRAARPDDERQRVAEALVEAFRGVPEVRRRTTVCVYASLPTEPGTGPLRVHLRSAGVRTLLPVPRTGPGAGKVLDWAVDDGSPDVPGALGIATPSGPRLDPLAIGSAHIVLVPAQAVDTAGTRLGRGGGYYDRALHFTGTRALVLAVVHDDELLDAARTPLPCEDHDLPVHGALTPSGCIPFRIAR